MTTPPALYVPDSYIHVRFGAGALAGGLVRGSFEEVPVRCPQVKDGDAPVPSGPVLVIGRDAAGRHCALYR